jgi:hypothetical protein
VPRPDGCKIIIMLIPSLQEGVPGSGKGAVMVVEE